MKVLVTLLLDVDGKEWTEIYAPNSPVWQDVRNYVLTTIQGCSAAETNGPIRSVKLKLLDTYPPA